MKLLGLSRVPFLVIISAFILSIPNGESTIIIPTLMAMGMGGGLLMSKMTLGGLMMMLMAANQQQNGQGFLRNLGVIPQATPSTGISVPTHHQHHEHHQGGNGESEPFQELLVRRRRYLRREKRDAEAAMKNVTETGSNKTLTADVKKPLLVDEITQYRIMRQAAASDPLNCLPSSLCGIAAITPTAQTGFLNDYTYLLTTLFTRDENIDDLDDNEEDATDLAQFDKLKYTTGKNTKKPTAAASNFAQLYTKSETTKNKNVNKKPLKNKKKKKPAKDDESSEEEEDDAPLNEEDLDKAMLKEQYEVEEMANEELLNDEPDFFPYAIRDTMGKLGPYGGPPRRPDDMDVPREEQEFQGVAPSDLNRMSEAELDALLSRVQGGSQGPAGPPGHGPPGYGPPGQGRPPPVGPPSRDRGSLLSNMMPKVAMGFTPGKTDSFGDDPFFSGFKRSIARAAKAAGDGSVEVDVNVRAATEEEEKLFKEMVKRRRSQIQYFNAMKKELSEIKDPVEQFRIAADFGAKTKSPRQCRVLFGNNCPFGFNQMLEMMAGLRKVILGQPLKEPEKDTVVTLKPVATPAPPPPTPAPTPAPQGSKSIINVNTGSGALGGVTSIQHQLPSGEKVEINLKMTKTGLSQSSTGRRRTKPKRPSENKSAMPPHLAVLTSSKNKKKPSSTSDPFDDEERGVKIPEHIAVAASSMSNLESLKATMLAIQKINNVTVQRKKSGKPTTFGHILAELDGSENDETTTEAPTTTTTEEPSLPEPDPLVLSKLQAQNSKPKPNKKTNSPQKTATLLASSLSTPKEKVEDDEIEIEERIPTPALKLAVQNLQNQNQQHIQNPALPPRRQAGASSQGSKSNEELAQILSDLKKVNAAKGSSSENLDKKKKPTADDEDDATDEDEDEDEDDEGEDDIVHLNSAFKSDLKDDEDRVVISVPLPETPERITATQVFEKRRLPLGGGMSSRERNADRKPRRLYRYDASLPRYFPL